MSDNAAIKRSTTLNRFLQYKGARSLRMVMWLLVMVWSLIGIDGNPKASLGHIGIPLVNDPAHVIWVTENRDADGDGVQDDQAFIDLLLDAGFDLDVQPGHWLELDDAKIGALNAADLIIISRSVNSGNYNQGNEPALWNGLTTPLLQMSSHLARANRWQWFNTSNLLALQPGRTQVLAPSHLVFTGLDLDENDGVQLHDNSVGSGQSNFTLAESGGNGSVLATTSDGLIQIVEWPTGVEFYDGSGQWTGDKRLFFTGGTQETGGTPHGAMNLNSAGQHALLNAVEFMLPTFESLLLENSSFERPGTTKLADWESIPGWNSDTVAVDSGVDTRWSPTDGQWSAYLFGPDPSVWQLTNHTPAAGEVITLRVDAEIIWMATTLQMTLYYDDNGDRIPAASADIILPGETMQTYSLVLNVDDVPEAIGKSLGIEFNNVTDPAVGNNWLALDNVQLDIELIE